MLNSFWNLCRICPSMPTEKFNSEYKTHFKWHDSSYRAPIQEAIKRQTEPSTQQLGCEPALSRKKKYPALAYRTHQVLRMVKSDGLDSLEMLALTNREDNRARSEERGKNRRGSLRSRSVDPYLGRRHQPILMTQSYPPAGHASTDASDIPKTTEYRSQFAWPPGSVADDKLTSPPRKSISMGTIQGGQDGGEKQPLMDGRLEMSDFRSPCNEEVLTRALEEQIIEGAVTDEPGRRKKFKTEYKARFKSPSKYTCIDGSWIKAKDGQLEKSRPAEDGGWYDEVLELRRKAGEYKVRALGTALPLDHESPVSLSHQEELWKQVSQRSSLSALALAATPREKEQNAKAVKDRENLRQARLAKPRAKSAVPLAPRPRKPRPPSHVIPRVDSARTPTRHHLERTTPAVDGSLLMSPTRDHRLEPVTTTSPKSKPKTTAGDVSRRSPKHVPRAHSVASTQRSHATPDSKRQQRPTSLASIPKAKAKPKEVAQDGQDTLAKIHLPVRSIKTKPKAKEVESKKVEENENEEKDDGTEEEMKMNLINGIASEQQKVDEVPPAVKSPDQVPLIKSPPEPTRVKSPEQISAKSPEPVKWTIPLDTGIKWTENLIIDDGSMTDKISPSFHPPITDTGLYTNGDLLSEEDN